MEQRRISNLTIIIFLIVGLAGFVVFQLFYDEAFPEASVDLKITRDDAVEKSREFLTEMGFDLAGYSNVVVFKQSRKSIDFLERELGLAKANLIFQETTMVYAWKVRWFKELEEVEYSYSITPDGRFCRFKRTYPEKTPGERLSREQALEIANEFIKTYSGLDPDKLEYIEHKEYDRPDRLDRSFTWRLKGFDFSDSQYRYSVKIQGAQVGQFKQWLYIPEKWGRDREELAGQRGNLEKLVSIFVVLLTLVGFIFFIWLIYKRDVRWKPALFASGLLGAITILTQLNNIPLAYLEYVTTESFSSFWTKQMMETLLYGIGGAFGMLFLFAASEGAGRHYMPDRIHCSGVFRGGFLSSRDSKRQMILGYAMALAMLGYVTLFYVFGQRYGNVWAPVEVPISNTFSTYFPSMQAIYVGVAAAMGEELLFRLLPIALLLRFTKRPWLAILLPAVIWGFAHTGYPQEPIWIRGAELTFAGIIFGWVFYRFGLLTTLTSHFVFNCFVGVVLQFQSGDLGLVLNAIAALSVPIIFMAFLPVFRIAGKRFKFLSVAKVDTKVKKDAPVAAPVLQPEAKAEKVVARPISGRLFWGLLLVSAGLFIAGLFIPVKDFYGKPPAVKLTQQEAYEKCLHYLAEAGIDPEGYRHFTYYRDYTDTLPKYAFDQLGIEKTYEDFSDRFEYQPRWYTRWFKEKTIRKYRVGIYDDGQLRILDINLADDETGLTSESRSHLEEGEARTIAENFLQSRGINLHEQLEHDAGDKIEATKKISHDMDFGGLWKEIEVKKVSKPNRVDWEFTYRDESFSLVELESRRSLAVSGDRVVTSNASRYDVPEKWKRKRELAKEHLRNTISKKGKIALNIGFILFLLVQFSILLAKGHVRKLDLLWAFGGFFIFGFLTTIIERINKIPNFFFAYYFETEQTFKSYAMGKLVEIPLFIIGGFILYVTLLMLLQVFLRVWASKTGGLAPLLKTIHPRRWWKTYNIQGVIIGIGLFLFALGYQSISQAIQGYFFPGNYFPADATSFKYFNQYSEFLYLAGLSSRVFVVLLNTSFLILSARRFLKKDRFIIPVIFLLALFWGEAESLSTSHMLLIWTLQGVKLIAIYLIITRILKWNIMAYIIYLWLDTYFSDGMGRFLSSHSEFFWIDIQRIVWLVLPVVLVLGTALWQKINRRDKEPADQ